MSLAELFVIAVGLSMDAFAVSVCKGLAMPKMNWKGALLVGLYFGGFQAAMPLFGYFLGSSFSLPYGLTTTGCLHPAVCYRRKHGKRILQQGR